MLYYPHLYHQPMLNYRPVFNHYPPDIFFYPRYVTYHQIQSYPSNYLNQFHSKNLYSNRKTYTIIKILPRLLKEYDEAMKKGNEKKIQQVLAESSAAIQELENTVNYSDTLAIPSNYPFIREVMNWIKSHHYTLAQKYFLRDFLTYFINLARTFKERVTESRKRKWTMLLEDIEDLKKTFLPLV